MLCQKPHAMQQVQEIKLGLHANGILSQSGVKNDQDHVQLQANNASAAAEHGAVDANMLQLQALMALSTTKHHTASARDEVASAGK